MENSFKIISSTASSCGSCHTTGCGTCAPAPPKVERTTLISRRDLGRTSAGGFRWCNSGWLLQPATVNRREDRFSACRSATRFKRVR